jgi:hypothetical protein
VDYCQACTACAPTKQVTFHQNVGIVFIRFPSSISGQLCRACIDANFFKMSLISFFFGWWGVISFFWTLVTLPMNVITWLGCLSLPRQFSPAS